MRRFGCIGFPLASAWYILKLITIKRDGLKTVTHLLNETFNWYSDYSYNWKIAKNVVVKLNWFMPPYLSSFIICIHLTMVFYAINMFILQQTSSVSPTPTTKQSTMMSGFTKTDPMTERQTTTLSEEAVELTPLEQKIRLAEEIR